jgi:LmbE family N-acetylglucosaminyl deacetylase
MTTRRPRVLLIFAHCDDELVCGWPILQENAFEKEIIIISSDKFNKRRRWCSHRSQVTRSLCETLCIRLTILDYNSDFYALPYRCGARYSLEKQLAILINQSSYDYVYTHNPYGEYSHPDHVFTWHIVSNIFCKKLLISDLRMSLQWSSPFQALASKSNRFFYSHQLFTSRRDLNFFNWCKSFYDSQNTWTWNYDIPTIAGVYVV